jgi:hypothetical protein
VTQQKGGFTNRTWFGFDIFLVMKKNGMFKCWKLNVHVRPAIGSSYLRFVNQNLMIVKIDIVNLLFESFCNLPFRDLIQPVDPLDVTLLEVLHELWND